MTATAWPTTFARKPVPGGWAERTGAEPLGRLFAQWMTDRPTITVTTDRGERTGHWRGTHIVRNGGHVVGMGLIIRINGADAVFDLAAVLDARITAGPSLPACRSFAGSGRRCTACRVHRNIHE